MSIRMIAIRRFGRYFCPIDCNYIIHQIHQRIHEVCQHCQRKGQNKEIYLYGNKKKICNDCYDDYSVGRLELTQNTTHRYDIDYTLSPDNSSSISLSFRFRFVYLSTNSSGVIFSSAISLFNFSISAIIFSFFSSNITTLS